MTAPARPRADLAYKILKNQELLLVGLTVLLLAAVVLAKPDFWHVETLFNILRASMVDIVFALGVLLVLLSGGIDVSFLPIGITAAYLTCKIAPENGSALTLFLLAMTFGVVMGLVNAVVVLSTKVTTLIATLATSAIFMGVLFTYIGGRIINILPASLQELGRKNLLTAEGSSRGTTRLSVLILVTLAACLLIAAMLRFTVLGRSILAIGGDAEAAQRAAVPVPWVRVAIFVIAGGLAGLAGIMHVTLSGRADPTTFMGRELDVIAAVVLGGAAITGGKGSVRGTFLGVILVSLIQTSLVPLGIPPIWQKATVGVLLLVGVSIQALASRRRPLRPILDPDDTDAALPAAPATQEA